MLNKVMLIGNLGADPEVRYMSSGDAVTTISLATSRRWRDKMSGEMRDATEWHRIVFFNIGNYKLAEIAGEYLKKGSQAYVEGRIQTRKWQDKNTGQDRYSTEIVAEQLHMLGSRSGGTGDFNQQGGYSAPAQQGASNFQQPPQQQPAQQFNQPAQQPVQQFNQPPAQQPFNQGQQQNAAMQPPVNQAQQQNTAVQPPANQNQQQPPLQPPPVQHPPAHQGFNQPPAQQTPPQNPSSAPVNDDFDDDIPF